MQVKQLKNKNQFIIIDDAHNKIYFQSYESLICVGNTADHPIAPSKLILMGDMWKYSKTTSKHFYIFLREYTNITANNKKEFLQEIKTNQNIEIH